MVFLFLPLPPVSVHIALFNALPAIKKKKKKEKPEANDCASCTLISHLSLRTIWNSEPLLNTCTVIWMDPFRGQCVSLFSLSNTDASLSQVIIALSLTAFCVSGSHSLSLSITVPNSVCLCLFLSVSLSLPPLRLSSLSPHPLSLSLLTLSSSLQGAR